MDAARTLNSIRPNSPSTWPTRRANSNVKQALYDRLLLSEAIEAVGRMIRGYANSGQAGKAYIGAIAELLMHYPSSVALKCADPFAGVSRETRFLPTPADVIGFCERAAAPLHEEAAREDRVAEQLAERERWLNDERDPVLLAKCRAWLDGSDPVKRALTGAYDAEAERARGANTALIQAGNRRLFERMCAADGVPATGIASPALRKLIGAQATAKPAEEA